MWSHIELFFQNNYTIRDTIMKEGTKWRKKN